MDELLPGVNTVIGVVNALNVAEFAVDADFVLMPNYESH